MRDGYMDLPTGPGLGIEIDEEALRVHLRRLVAARTRRAHGHAGPRRSVSIDSNSFSVRWASGRSALAS